MFQMLVKNGDGFIPWDPNPFEENRTKKKSKSVSLSSNLLKNWNEFYGVFSLPLPFNSILIWELFFSRISKGRRFFFREKKNSNRKFPMGLHHRVHRMILHDLKVPTIRSRNPKGPKTPPQKITPWLFQGSKGSNYVWCVYLHFSLYFLSQM